MKHKLYYISVLRPFYGEEGKQWSEECCIGPFTNKAFAKKMLSEVKDTILDNDGPKADGWKAVIDTQEAYGDYETAMAEIIRWSNLFVSVRPARSIIREEPSHA